MQQAPEMAMRRNGATATDAPSGTGTNDPALSTSVLEARKHGG
jgi:hypothetical protein